MVANTRAWHDTQDIVLTSTRRGTVVNVLSHPTRERQGAP
jgi:hypothetical protein